MMEYNCPVCKRRFIRAPKHLYKDGNKCFCSWTCFMHRNEEVKPRAVEQYSKCGRTTRTYQNIEEAADIIGGTINDIDSACKNCTFYKGYLWRYKNDVS